MWIAFLRILGIAGKRKFPSKVTPDDCAIIKLKNFDNLEVIILADKINGGLAISYNDSHLSPVERQDVQDEIETIISEMESTIRKESNNADF